MATRRVARSTAPNGRREHKKHLTRRELLAAGRRLFAAKGLYDSRIEDLSREAGIAKGTLYGYFANKEELIEAVVTNGFDELLGAVHRATASSPDRAAAIEAAARTHFEFFQQNPDLIRIFHQVRGLLKFNGPETRKLRAVLQSYLSGLAESLGRHPAPRRRALAGGHDVAHVLFGAISGIVSIHASIDRTVLDPVDSPETLRAVVALVQAFETPAAPARTAAKSPAARAPRRRTS